MEQLAGGGGARFRHQRSSDRFLGIFRPPRDSPEYSPPVELSEHDIFTTSSGASSRSDFKSKPNPNPNRESTNFSRKSHNGIFAALNEENRTGSGSETRPVFNRKASLAISPVTSPSSRISIPRRPPPPPDRVRLQRQSVPVNIPMMPAGVQRRGRGVDDVDSEEEDEEEVNEGEIVPPHEVVASRHSPMLACSVLEGAGRTLKGRDLRQVRNAIWRKTGFID